MSVVRCICGATLEFNYLQRSPIEIIEVIPCVDCIKER